MRSSTTFGDKVPFLIWALMWPLGAIVAIVSLAIDVLLPSMNHIVGRDFTNLWVAGRLAWAGQGQCAFDVNCFRDAVFQMLGLISFQNFSYPPTALFLAAPFGLMPYYVALLIWTLAGIAFFIWCAKPFLPEGFPPMFAALTPAAAINIWNGHYGLFFGGLWLLCFGFLRKKPEASGAFAGLLTLKPHLGLMIAITLFRNRRALTAAVLTTVVLITLSVAAFGLTPWSEFLLGTTSQQQTILTSPNDTFYFRLMPSAYVAFDRGDIGLAAQACSITATIALLVWSARWDAFSAATATFLLVPYVFNYDMTVACVGFAVIIFERWSLLSWPKRSTFLLAFLSPELTYFADWLVPATLLAALYFQLREGNVKVSRAETADGAQPPVCRQPVCE